MQMWNNWNTEQTKVLSRPDVSSFTVVMTPSEHGRTGDQQDVTPDERQKERGFVTSKTGAASSECGKPIGWVDVISDDDFTPQNGQSR